MYEKKILNNLKKEFEDMLKRINKTYDDIFWVGSEYFKITIENFKEVLDTYYHSGHGAQEIATDLIIVFKDNSYLIREEYDGAEDFVYHKTPDIPKTTKKIKTLNIRDGYGSCGWNTLSEVNGFDEGED